MCQIINKTIPIQAALHMDINMNTLRLAETPNVWCRWYPRQQRRIQFLRIDHYLILNVERF